MVEGGSEGDAGRRHPRVGCVLQLRYRSAGHLLVSYCTNLSRGGLFVASPDPLDVGATLTLALTVPGRSEQTRLAAKVRWTRPHDSDDGPAGMGLSFEGIDGILGDQIDDIVAGFTPLKIELVGEPERQTWRHISALVRSLVTSQTRHHEIDERLASALAKSDLVIVDVDAEPRKALALLEALHACDPRPPTVALCSSRNLLMRERAGDLARVVPLPIDSAELRACILEELSAVRDSTQI